MRLVREAKPWSDESEKAKALPILDDAKRSEEGTSEGLLNSLILMGAMTAVKRSEAAGKRVVQTRLVDREKDGCVDLQAGSEGLQSKTKGVLNPRCSAPTPSTLSLKTMLAVSSYGRNNHSESDHITMAIEVSTAFVHADSDQEFFAEPPEADE